MTGEYLKLFYKKKLNWILLAALFLVQALSATTLNGQNNLLGFFIAQKSLNMFALFFTPFFCAWNLLSYQVCSEVKCIVRMGSPFSYAMWYLKLSFLNSILYLFFSNILMLISGIVMFRDVSEFWCVLVWLFFQLLFYMNCAWLYFILVTVFHGKFYLGFLGVVLYGLLDYIGIVPAEYHQWINISTAYVVCMPDTFRNPLQFLQNFSVLMGTFLVLYVVSTVLIEKTDFMERGKGHD